MHIVDCVVTYSEVPWLRGVMDGEEFGFEKKALTMEVSRKQNVKIIELEPGCLEI